MNTFKKNVKKLWNGGDNTLVLAIIFYGFFGILFGSIYILYMLFPLLWFMLSGGFVLFFIVKAMLWLYKIFTVEL